MYIDYLYIRHCNCNETPYQSHSKSKNIRGTGNTVIDYFNLIVQNTIHGLDFFHGKIKHVDNKLPDTKQLIPRYLLFYYTTTFMFNKFDN